MQWLLDRNSSEEIIRQQAGGKAWNLFKMSHLGLRVPEWVCISSEWLKSIEQEASNFPKIDRELLIEQGCADISAQISSWFEKLNLTQVDTLAEQLDRLGFLDGFVAVRSSGLDEDSKDHSFAGQFSSFLYQKGLDQILASVKSCWASAYSERALAYRLEKNLALESLGVGVVIQRMVDSESSGVAFSRNPMHALDRKNVVVSSLWGQGEALVSGMLDADHFEINRDDFSIKASVVEKTQALKYQDSLQLVDLPLELQNKASLTDNQLKTVAQASMLLEEKIGSAQDIEWAFDKDEFFLLQTRPITNLPGEHFFDTRIKGAKSILWDNSNIIESYSGVTLPLTFSFASRAYYQVYVQFCEVMGVPQSLIDERQEMFRNMLGLVRGRIYYNLINWYRLVLMLPGSKTNQDFMNTMMGVKQQVNADQQSIFEIVSEAPDYSLLAKIKLAFKTFARFLSIDSIVNDFNANFNLAYQEARSADFSSWSLDEQFDYYNSLEERVLKKWHAPIINDYLCMIFFGILKSLTKKWLHLGEQSETLQNDLLCGEGGLESTEPTKALMRIAAMIDNECDDNFKSWFLSEDPSVVWQKLSNDFSSSQVYSMFQKFLDNYGFRCVDELKLESNDLHDDPSFAVLSVAGYIRSNSYDIQKMEEREKQIRKQAEASLKEQLGGYKLKIFFWVLKHARKAVKNRENLRFARTKIFGVTRHLLRAIGANLCRLDLIDQPHDIFYFSVEELFSWREGRCTSLNFRALAKLRREEFDKYETSIAPPDRFITQGFSAASFTYENVLADSDLLASLRDSDDPSTLYGTACSPGIVEGVVRLVKTMSDANNMNGEILVTERTDPGWVPLYPSCGGLLIERGSLLSHSAVVARELGLPTIVGVSGGLLKKLKTGQRVRMDGSKGEIKILD